MDTATQFYPWYSYLGESLRSFEVPGWNPSQLSGVPFAADPLSGWTYLPAMIFFTALPLAAAAKAYVFFHPLMAGISAYALGRSLRMGAAGSLVAGVAYAFTGFLYINNACCFAFAAVYAWLPIAILGAELALRSPSLLSRALYCGLSGLALSQILASWLGQGSYYALLALGGYVAYRALIFPPENIRGLRGRLSGAVFVGPLILVFGFGLAAAGLLPRLEYNSLSFLAGGYPEFRQIVGGWSAENWKFLIRPGFHYAGATSITLALAAPFAAGRRFSTPYFAALAVFALTFSGQGITPVHSLLYLLPRFEELHPHSPERIILVFYLAAAMLAGSALTALGEKAHRNRALVAIPALAAVFILTRSTLNPPVEPSGDGVSSFLTENGISLPLETLMAVILMVVLVSAYALLPRRDVNWKRAAAAVLVLVVFADLYAAGGETVEGRMRAGAGDALRQVEISSYYDPTQATRFLQSREGPFRYFGYYPKVTDDGTTIPYTVRFDDPKTRALLVNNRATLYGGLQSIQGYNPTHLARYDEYLEALNERSQNYHDADVFPGGIGSPLLDLLNARYITIPAGDAPGSPANFDELAEKYQTVYEDEDVKILENPGAMPRAWVVHSARKEEPEKILELLDSGEVDPRETALLESGPPNLESPADPSQDRAVITDYESGRIQLRASTGADGLLMLSEIDYPGWNAYVDGEPVPIRRADYLLRAVPLPAGEHTVELRYESRTLGAGVAFSSVTAGALVVLGAVRLLPRRKERSK